MRRACLQLAGDDISRKKAVSRFAERSQAGLKSRSAAVLHIEAVRAAALDHSGLLTVLVISPPD
jgi:hypothetical protein